MTSAINESMNGTPSASSPDPDHDAGAGHRVGPRVSCIGEQAGRVLASPDPSFVPCQHSVTRHDAIVAIAHPRVGDLLVAAEQVSHRLPRQLIRAL